MTTQEKLRDKLRLMTKTIGLIQMMKPSFIYNNDGSLREFGVGYRNKTILPLWLFSIVLGILTNILVLYYLTYPRII